MSQRNDPSRTIKISGYLEKKCKLKIKSWKKYWFVLEGQLLLYYRSKEEYDSISPCKGSINLYPPCNIIPATSLTNAFQIETRANHIILRATDRTQQEKWMEAILKVLKQDKIMNNNDKKLIQFRYSNDDLVNPPINRYSINDCEMVDRIKHIGGQTYGGSLGAINKASETMKKVNLPQSQSLVKLLQNKNVILDKRSSFNDNYHVLKNPCYSNKRFSYNERTSSCYDKKFSFNQKKSSINDKTSFINDKKSSINDKKSSINDKKSSINDKKSSINDKKSSGNKKSSFNDKISEKSSSFKDKSSTVKDDFKRPVLTRSISDNRTKSLLVDNEQYVTDYTLRLRDNEENIYERISQDYATKVIDKERNSTKSVVIENDQYVLFDDVYKNEEVEYTYIPKEPEQVHIKEPVGESNEIAGYAITKEPEYALTRDEYALTEPEYALTEPEYALMTEPEYFPTDHEYATTEPEYAIPMKKTDRNKNSLILDNDLYDFSKNVHDSTTSEVLYEEPEMCKTADVKIELPIAKKKHSIAKSIRMSASRVSKIWRKKTKKSIDVKPTTTTSIDNHTQMNSVEVLEELQKILENKKSEIEEKAKKSQEHFQTTKEDDKATLASVVQETNEIPAPNQETDKPPANNPAEPVPELPPHKQRNVLSPIYDVPRNNCPVLTKKKYRRSNIINNNNIKTIDEILEDLDKDCCVNKPSVRELIEKFDEKSQVVLRNKLTHRKSTTITDIRHSDDLNKLLEDLAKITNAPILTPGITNSLNVPNTSTKEWHDLGPRLNRRNSEPDYDIPRSHKPPHLLTTSELLINNYVKSDEDSEKESSYFGTEDTDYSTDSDVFIHPMDPDSLEIDKELSDITYATHLNDLFLKPVNCTTGSSNIYENDLKIYKYEDVPVDSTETIYAKPRLLFTKAKNMDSIERKSLESCGESSTIF